MICGSCDGNMWPDVSWKWGGIVEPDIVIRIDYGDFMIKMKEFCD